MIAWLATILAFLQARLEELPSDLLDRLPSDTVEKIKQGALERLPSDVVDALPDEVAAQIPDSLVEAAQRNQLLAVLAVLAAIGFVWGLFKRLVKLAIGLAVLAVVLWFLYLRS